MSNLNDNKESPNPNWGDAGIIFFLIQNPIIKLTGYQANVIRKTDRWPTAQ